MHGGDIEDNTADNGGAFMPFDANTEADANITIAPSATFSGNAALSGLRIDNERMIANLSINPTIVTDIGMSDRFAPTTNNDLNGNFVFLSRLRLQITT